MKFNNQIILVTGGSRGIGAATVKLFAKHGATVIINYHTNKEAAQATLDAVDGNGMIIQADVSKESDVTRMFSTIKEKYGTIDILINNAGIVNVKPFKELTLDDWNKTMDTNLTSMFLCSKAALPLMNAGSIINISSIRGLLDQGRAPITDYSTSKAAAISFTKTLAKEVAPNIRVNTVGPGMTNTDNVQKILKESIEQFKKDIYLERLVEPEEVASAIIFLCSKEASAITGTLLMVDGGQSLS